MNGQKQSDIPTSTFQPSNEEFKENTTQEDIETPDFLVNLDICFLLDCTGSMQSYIDLARDKIKGVIQQVRDQNPGSQVYVGIVGYRDVQDSNRFEILPFTQDIDQARAFLDGIRASGGGDTPEDVNGAFQQALKMKWQSDAKMIFHIADAPCHGTEYHKCGGDNHPNGYKDDAPWGAIFKQIITLRIDYLFLKILSDTDMMFEKFKLMGERLGAVDNGVLFKQEAIPLPQGKPQNRLFSGGFFRASLPSMSSAPVKMSATKTFGGAMISSIDTFGRGNNSLGGGISGGGLFWNASSQSTLGGPSMGGSQPSSETGLVLNASPQTGSDAFTQLLSKEMIEGINRKKAQKK